MRPPETPTVTKSLFANYLRLCKPTLSVRKFPFPELTRTSTAGRAPAAHGYGAGNLDVPTTDGGRGTGDVLRPCTHKPVGVTRLRLRSLCPVSDQARAAA